jgi:hypothetical protein
MEKCRLFTKVNVYMYQHNGVPEYLQYNARRCLQLDVSRMKRKYGARALVRSYDSAPPDVFLLVINLKGTAHFMWETTTFKKFGIQSGVYCAENRREFSAMFFVAVNKV